MKKILLVLTVLVMAANLTACFGNRVSLSQIKQDLQVEVSDIGLTVNDVKVDLLKNEDIRSVVHITAEMTSPEATITRMYTMIYDYYEVGGWVLNECNATKQEQWVAYPDEINITEEIVCDVIFEDWVEGGYRIRDSAVHDEELEIFSNAQFGSWTRGSISELPKTNNLESYEITKYDDNNARATVVANCQVHSDVIEIKESFEIEFFYDPVRLSWIAVSGQSISDSYEFLVDITGTYEEETNSSSPNYITIINNGTDYLISKDEEYGDAGEFSNVVLNVKGLFENTFNDEITEHEHWGGLEFYSNPLSLYFYDNYKTGHSNVLSARDNGTYYKQ